VLSNGDGHDFPPVQPLNRITLDLLKFRSHIRGHVLCSPQKTPTQGGDAG
jgi:hypothetical protein